METPEENTGEQINNAKPKSKKGIIVAVIAIVIIIVALVGIIFCLNVNKQDAESQNPENVNVIKKGEVELVYTSTNEISEYDYKNQSVAYFETEENGEKNIIDADGNIVLEKRANSYDSYLGDGYFFVSSYENGSTYKVIKENKEIFSSDAMEGTAVYDNNILYYYEWNASYGGGGIVAFDLKNQKELWRTKTDSIIDLSFEGTFLKMKQIINATYDSYSEMTYSKIVDLDGKIIAESTSDYAIYATSSQYYIKSKEKQYVEVYDLNKNKISELSLKTVDNTQYKLIDVLENGMYIIQEVKNGDARYKLYNINSQLIKDSSTAILKNKETKTNAAIASADKELLLKKDGTGILETGFDIGDGSEYEYEIKSYIIMEKYPENDIIVNLNNEKTIEMPIAYPSENFEQSPNGKYIILYGDSSYVYNSDFNKVYESQKYLVDINDEYILEIDAITNQLYIINIVSGEKKELETKGQYYSNNVRGIITKDEENYYLYAIR